jgi:hypothetical protein
MTAIDRMNAPTRRVILSLLAATAVISCSQSLAIWIIEGSTVDRLRFGVAYNEQDSVPVPVYSITVEECYLPDTVSARVYWELTYAGWGAAPKFRQLEYGETPGAYRSRNGPKPLNRASCYYANFRKSRKSYPHARVIFLTDSLGGVTPINGLALERLKLHGSEPPVLSEGVRTRAIDGNPAVVAGAVRQVLIAHGFAIASFDSGVISTAQLKLGRTWDNQEVAERVDCGRWVEGGNRVRLPLARDSADGYGHLLVTIQVSIKAHQSSAVVTLKPDVWLNPPWFEQGDRPMMPCTIRPSFATALLDEVAQPAVR